MNADLETRTKAALRQFDSNMSGIFDRASFYDQDLYSQAAYPQLTKSQMCFKYTLLATNLLFFIFGCVLIAVGSYAVTNSIGQLSGSTLPTGITVLGVFILLLSLVGGVAAYKEIRILLILYFVFLLLITFILFFVGIAVYVERNQVDSLISSGWNYAAPDLRSNLEHIFACCGCCTAAYAPRNSTADPFYPCNATVSPTMQGCLPVFDSYLSSYYVTAGGCGIAFAVFMLIGMVIVCFLMDGIKKKKAEQDLAKLRANNNNEETDLKLKNTSGRDGGMGEDDGEDLMDDDEDDDEDDDDDEEHVR